MNAQGGPRSQAQQSYIEPKPQPECVCPEDECCGCEGLYAKCSCLLQGGLPS